MTGNVWWLNWDCSIVDKFFRIHLRHIKLFYDVYLLSLISKSTFKIIFLGGYVLRIELIVNWENKNWHVLSKISNLKYHIIHQIFCRFSGIFLLKRRHLMNFYNSAKIRRNWQIKKIRNSLWWWKRNIVF